MEWIHPGPAPGGGSPGPQVEGPFDDLGSGDFWDLGKTPPFPRAPAPPLPRTGGLSPPPRGRAPSGAGPEDPPFPSCIARMVGWALVRFPPNGRWHGGLKKTPGSGGAPQKRTWRVGPHRSNPREICPPKRPPFPREIPPKTPGRLVKGPRRGPGKNPRRNPRGSPENLRYFLKFFFPFIRAGAAL